MTIKRAGYILFIFFIMFLMGCATGISRQSRSKVTYAGTFSELQKTPDVYKDEIIMLGGKILETNVSSTLSQLTVLQLALGNNDRPVNLDQSHGRFIVESKQFLDPAIYQKGMLLTLVGKLKGSKIRAIGGFDYVYPLLEPIEIKLWPMEILTQPRFHFGFGVGTVF
jgi:outer membrane lipoprotein